MKHLVAEGPVLNELPGPPCETTIVKHLVVLCACLTAVGCGNPISDVLPQASDVTAIEARLYNRPDSGPDIAPFSILQADFPKVLSLFDGAKVDHNPASWQGLGALSITKSDGSTCLVVLYWTGAGPGAFSIDGYYRGSSDNEIISTLSACYAATHLEEGFTEQPPEDDNPGTATQE